MFCMNVVIARLSLVEICCNLHGFLFDHVRCREVYRVRRAKMRHLPYSFRQRFESFVENVMSSRLHLCKGNLSIQ